MSGNLVDDVLGTAREGKPRENGITVASDLLRSVDSGLLEQIAEYIDVVKIGLGAPLVLERSRLLERIHRYHDLGIRVMCGGTSVEVAVQKGVVPQVLEGLRALGFDMIEVSEHAGKIPLEAKREIASSIAKLSMEYIFEVGSRDRPATSADSTIPRIREAFELKSRRVVVEVPQEDRRTVREDARGEIRWDVLDEVVGAFGPPNLIFETGRMGQLTALILEFGLTVNLAGVPLDDVLILEMERLGLTTETLGLSRPLQSFEGSPAAKFIYHLIRSEHPIDQATLGLRSGLPRRTVQAALNSLVGNGLVREVSDAADLRRHRYTIR